jgi:hypothetical protein
MDGTRGSALQAARVSLAVSGLAAVAVGVLWAILLAGEAAGSRPVALTLLLFCLPPLLVFVEAVMAGLWPRSAAGRLRSLAWAMGVVASLGVFLTGPMVGGLFCWAVYLVLTMNVLWSSRALRRGVFLPREEPDDEHYERIIVLPGPSGDARSEPTAAEPRPAPSATEGAGPTATELSSGELLGAEPAAPASPLAGWEPEAPEAPAPPAAAPAPETVDSTP